MHWPHHMRCGVVMKVRQAATTPAMTLDVIRMFSLGNLKAVAVCHRMTHTTEAGPFSPHKTVSRMMSLWKAQSMPVSHHSSSGEQKKGREQAHDDDQGDQKAILASKLLNDVYRCHKVEPCCTSTRRLYTATRSCFKLSPTKSQGCKRALIRQ